MPNYNAVAMRCQASVTQPPGSYDTTTPDSILAVYTTAVGDLRSLYNALNVQPLWQNAQKTDSIDARFARRGMMTTTVIITIPLRPQGQLRRQRRRRLGQGDGGRTAGGDRGTARAGAVHPRGRHEQSAAHSPRNGHLPARRVLPDGRRADRGQFLAHLLLPEVFRPGRWSIGRLLSDTSSNDHHPAASYVDAVYTDAARTPADVALARRILDDTLRLLADAAQRPNAPPIMDVMDPVVRRVSNEVTEMESALPFRVTFVKKKLASRHPRITDQRAAGCCCCTFTITTVTHHRQRTWRRRHRRDRHWHRCCCCCRRLVRDLPWSPTNEAQVSPMATTSISKMRVVDG